MMLNQITGQAGGRPRRKRVGRGESSGHGKTCGRGNKGAQARAGCSIRPLAEGGQMPIFRRLPKRGFSNFHFRTEYQPVNLGTLESAFESGGAVDAAQLAARGLIGDASAPVKILATGSLTKKLAVRADSVSAKARELIEKAGGSVTLLPRRNRAALAKAKRNSVKKAKAAGQRRPPRERRRPKPKA